MKTRTLQSFTLCIGALLISLLFTEGAFSSILPDTTYINNILTKAHNYSTSNPEKSDSLAQIALYLSQSVNFKKGEARACKTIACINRISNHNIDAIKYYYKSLQYYESKDPVQTMEIYQWLGLSLAFEAYYDSGKVYLEKSIQIADSFQLKEPKAQSYLNMARLYRIMGHLSEALNSCLKALSICDSIQNQDLTWKVKNFTGFVYLQNNMHKEAAEILNENILKYKEYMHMPEEVYRLLYYTSDLDLFFKNFDRAVQYQKIALKITDLIPNKNLASYFRAMSHEALSKAYMQQSEFDSAKYHLSQANNNKEYLLDLHAKANLYYSIGDVFYELHQSDSALYYFIKSAGLHKNNMNYTKLRIANLGIGKTYYQMHNYVQAKKYLYQAIGNKSDKANIEVLSKAWLLLSNIYEKENDYKNAYKYHRLHKKASDGLFSNEKVKNITKLELEYTFLDKQKQLENLREQERISYEAKLKQNKLTRNFSAVGFILSLIIAGFAYTNYKTKKKANQQKENLLREIHHRVKNNLQVISSMLSLQGSYLTDQKIVEAINESQGRVKSMALIHQMLYQHDSFSSIDMYDYIIQLCNAISSSYQSKEKEIKVFFELEKITIDIDTAIPVGLIINELLTNAYKYAFKDRTEGNIFIGLNQTDNNTYCLKIADNGTGINKEVKEKRKNSFGLNMVDVLTRQLKGEISLENKIGTSYVLKFREIVKTSNKK